MSEYIITVDENDERWHSVEQQYTHFFGYPIAEEIVRCWKCKYFYCLTAECYVCARNEKFMPWVEPDGFCKWGEPRGENVD